jgi:hypothetical protein
MRRCMLLVCIAYGRLLYAQTPLSLHIELPMRQVELGEPIPVQLTFSNDGGEPVFVEYTGVDYGEAGVTICAVSGDERFTHGPGHIDRDASVMRFDYVPLRSGQRFTATALSMNDVEAAVLPSLVLSRAGTYAIRVTFTSEGPTSEGTIWPIWRGRISSDDQQLVVLPSRAERVSERRRQLAKCVADGYCDPDIVGYFRIVKDGEAADLLLQLFELSTPVPPFVLEAIFQQGRKRDLSVLDEYATRSAAAKAEVDHIRSAAVRSAPCF